MTQDLPTTEDGKVYILLGYMYSTTGFRLIQYHPVYEFKNGSIRPYTPPATKAVTDAASSGTIEVVAKTVKTLSTTLTNAHTVVISPTVPADLTQEQEATLILKTGATVPAISFATAGVTFVWMNQPEPTAYIINKTYTFLFFWESATVCQVFYAVKS